jgi:tetrahydromethanopterin S-methyltransferase subunit G
MADKTESLSTKEITNTTVMDKETFEEELIKHAVLRLNGNVSGIVLGVITALVIFVATNWLVFKGGTDVGAHLNLLGQFFIGYSVTFAGSLIGMIYGFLTGYAVGFLIAWIYNKVVILKDRR